MNDDGAILDGKLTVGTFVLDDDGFANVSILAKYVDFSRGKTIGTLLFVLLSDPNILIGAGHIASDSIWCSVDRVLMMKARLNSSSYEN